MTRQIKISMQEGAGGVGYIINPDEKTYVSGPLQNGELQLDSDKNYHGEYVDAQKLTSQLYYLILAGMNDGSSRNQREDG